MLEKFPVQLLKGDNSVDGVAGFPIVPFQMTRTDGPTESPHAFVPTASAFA